MRALTSIASLTDDQWVLRNVEDPSIVTHGEWLDDVISAHRHTLRDGGHVPIEIHYEIGSGDTSERIEHVREAANRARALRNEARLVEATVADDREELVDRLTDERVAPTEIAEILGLSVRTVRDALGSDEEARIARAIMRTLTDRDAHG